MKTLGRYTAVFVLMLAPALAHAEDLTLFGGIQNPGKIDLRNAPSTGTTGATQIITNPGTVGVFGLRYGGGSVVGHEETFAYAPNFLDSNSKAVILNSNLKVEAPLPVVKPYATAGLGTIISWGTGVSDIGSKFAVNYGGGLKVMPGPVGVRGDVRGYIVPGISKQTLNVVEVSLGVIFKF